MDNVVPIRKPPRSSSRSILLSLLVTVIFAAVYYYVALPALNPKSADLYRYILFLCIVYALGTLIFSGGRLRQEPRAYFAFVKSHCKVPLVIVILCLLVCLVGALSSAVFFRAGSYARLLQPQTSNFPPTSIRSLLTRSRCWTRTPPSGWATGNWAS